MLYILDIKINLALVYYLIKKDIDMLVRGNNIYFYYKGDIFIKGLINNYIGL